MYSQENICTYTQTHNHNDLGYLYKAGGLAALDKEFHNKVRVKKGNVSYRSVVVV